MLRPAQVVVYDFAVSPEQVTLDTGVGPRLMHHGETTSTLQSQEARETQEALAETLAERLGAYGLPVTRMAAGAVPPPDSLLVQGQIGSVNKGNRTRRVLIGFGAGKSNIDADSQLYYVTDPSRPVFLAAFNGSADSGRMPGAAETMGAGAAAQRLATSAAVSGATHAGAEARRTERAAIADKLADGLARKIGDYAAGQGWIMASAVR